MNEEMHGGESNAEVEAAEKVVLGKNYEVAEKLHTYANENSWVHPVMGVVILVLIIGIVVYVKKRNNKSGAQI